MRPSGATDFESLFADEPDPWRTFTARDEALKRRAVLAALGPRAVGRVLELGAGAGANSVQLARRALRLDATDAARSALDRVAAALGSEGRVRVLRLQLPSPFPRPVYDAVVIAEVLYYLSAPAMVQVARETASTLAPGGVLVLAHHHVQFHDFVQPARGIHLRFLRAVGRPWRMREVGRTRRWSVLACRIE